MKKVLSGCIVANILYCYVEFSNIITPAYIISLLCIIIISSKGEIKLAKILSIFTAIIGILLSIFNLGNIMIIACGIILIMEVIRQYFMEINQIKYNSSVGISTDKRTGEIKESFKKHIVTKYDIDLVKDSFDTFLSDYDKTNKMIDLQYKHTINVAQNAVNIAASIGLDEEGKFLAYLVGILHDIGKFEQIKEYNTIEDNNEVDHANLGSDLLEDGLIRQFVHGNKYDKIIFKVVKDHNKLCIDDNFTDDEKLYCSIIRDADKLDIFKRLSEGKCKEDYNVNNSEYNR
jgi:putative nucleotidyltransferase with HDIG domain